MNFASSICFLRSKHVLFREIEEPAISYNLEVLWWLKFGKCQATDLRVSDENMPLDRRKVSVQEKQCGRLHGIP